MSVSMTMTGTLPTASKTGRTVWRRAPGLLVTVLLLTGCPGATMTPDGASLRTDGGAGDRKAAHALPLPKPKPAAVPAAAPSEAQPVAQSTVARLPEVPAPPVSTGPVEPETIVGLDQGQTRRLLGSPAATEEEAPARVWRYADDACTLKVFFFMDMTSRDFRALSYDMKSTDNVRDADDRCFARLLAQAGDDARDER